MSEVITLGSDVEVQVMDYHGNLISAVGLIGGSKDAPMLVDFGNLQEDNVNAEFAIDPVQTEDEWVRNITHVLKSLDDTLELNGYTYRIEPWGRYPDEQLQSEAAQQFACDPDFSIYTGGENVIPPAHIVGSFRTCGAHIHVGGAASSAEEIIPWMDALLALPSLFKDNDRQRRRLYGQAGAFRPKPYGFEYRTLSNFWIKNERDMRWAYQSTHKAIQLSKEEDISQVPMYDNIPEIINQYDLQAAESIMDFLINKGWSDAQLH